MERKQIRIRLKLSWLVRLEYIAGPAVNDEQNGILSFCEGDVVDKNKQRIYVSVAKSKGDLKLNAILFGISRSQEVFFTYIRFYCFIFGFVERVNFLCVVGVTDCVGGRYRGCAAGYGTR